MPESCPAPLPPPSISPRPPDRRAPLDDPTSRAATDPMAPARPPPSIAALRGSHPPSAWGVQSPCCCREHLSQPPLTIRKVAAQPAAAKSPAEWPHPQHRRSRQTQGGPGRRGAVWRAGRRWGSRCRPAWPWQLCKPPPPLFASAPVAVVFSASPAPAVLKPGSWHAPMPGCALPKSRSASAGASWPQAAPSNCASGQARKKADWRRPGRRSLKLRLRYLEGPSPECLAAGRRPSRTRSTG
mmetsp:Transcript_35672/g.102779  ORF Transcript_35672/g.102779 Transcript_35672/m.102779 type:complete len:241 (-) Transcript_35672:358-1080(-)